MSALDFRFLRRPRDLDEAPALPGLVVGLDIGASKIACLIGHEGPPGTARSLVGVGRQPSRLGLTGDVGDLEETIRGIGIAVDEAERMAGLGITGAAVSYGGPGVKTRRLSVSLRLREPIIEDRHLNQLQHQAGLAIPTVGRAVLDVTQIGYRVDGGPIVPDPRGASGRSLGLELAVISAPLAAISALEEACAQANLGVCAIVPAAAAAGLACLTAEERAAGAVIIDLGALTTGIAVTGPEGLIFAETLPIGAIETTRALARKLETSFAVAERAKLALGCTTEEPRETLAVPRLGPDGRLEPAAVLRRAVVEVIAASLDHTLGQVARRLEMAGFAGGHGALPAVVVGGGAQFSGCRDLASHALKRPVRIGRPLALTSAEQLGDAPSLAVAAGLLACARTMPGPNPPARAPMGEVLRVGEALKSAAIKTIDWVRTNF